MSIKDRWLERFRAVVDGEIALHAKKSDAYRAVAMNTGLGYDYIYQIYTGKPESNPKTPGVDAMKALERAYGQKQLGNVDAARAFTGEVPVISWVQAGSWNEAADPFQPGDAEQFLPIFRGHSSNTFALKVRGDSMTAPHGKSYPEGSYIIVDPAKLGPVNGDRIIAKLEGSDEVTFKVFKDEDGRKWLAPLNSSHPPIIQPFKIIGTVIGKWEDE